MDKTKQVSFPLRFSHTGLAITSVGFKPDAQATFDYMDKLEKLVKEYLPVTNIQYIDSRKQNIAKIKATQYGSIEEWRKQRYTELKEKFPDGTYYFGKKGTRTLATGKEGAIQLQLSLEEIILKPQIELLNNQKRVY